MEKYVKDHHKTFMNSYFTLVQEYDGKSNRLQGSMMETFVLISCQAVKWN